MYIVIMPNTLTSNSHPHEQVPINFSMVDISSAMVNEVEVGTTCVCIIVRCSNS